MRCSFFGLTAISVLGLLPIKTFAQGMDLPSLGNPADAGLFIGLRGSLYGKKASTNGQEVGLHEEGAIVSFPIYKRKDRAWTLSAGVGALTSTEDVSIPQAENHSRDGTSPL